jgi:large subunit ribosomal protein L10
MNKDQKAAVVEEIASQIKDSEAVFAVDYRGISVPQAAELRQKLTEAGARFRVVKNTLTIRAAEQAGADELKELLEGPTAFTFVTGDGDVALAAKALAQFRREHDVLNPKGGRMGGEPISIEQFQELARLPALDVLHGQLVGVVASPITGLVRGLNQLIAGFAQQLQQLVDQGLVGGEAEQSPVPSPQSPEPQAEADQEAQADEAEGEAEESAGTEEEGGEPSTEGEAPQDAGETPVPSPQSPETDEPPSEGDQDEKEGE